ncbi:hypothetical protein [Lacipirellula parvula]|nr:hypothetical protein [Lacipirellula parvula]
MTQTLHLIVGNYGSKQNGNTVEQVETLRNRARAAGKDVSLFMDAALAATLDRRHYYFQAIRELLFPRW